MPLKLLTLKETAEILRRSPAQLRYMRHKKQGPDSALIAGRVMYRYDDVVRFIDAAFDAQKSSGGV